MGASHGLTRSRLVVIGRARVYTPAMLATWDHRESSQRADLQWLVSAELEHHSPETTGPPTPGVLD